MSVGQSGGLRMDIGVLYLSHAMLVLAELIVYLHLYLERYHFLVQFVLCEEGCLDQRRLLSRCDHRYLLYCHKVSLMV